MARGSLVAVSYPVDGEFAQVNTSVLDGLAEVAFLDGRPDAEFRDILRQADVLIGWHLGQELPAGVLLASPGLRLIQLLSAGADSVDFAAIPERLALASNVGAYAEPMAEYVMAMALALARRLPRRHADLAKGEFKMWERVLTLDGAVCAILGFGGIGRATARLMRAFGARIHAVNSSGQTSEPVDFIGTLCDLDRVLAAADVLVIALPLTNATRGLIGARELSLMYPFFDLPNLLGSPHNSGVTDNALHVGVRMAAENVRRFLTGEAVIGVARPGDYL
jgi:phosphoglycerate dehydrogenase-like enzyme